MVWHCFGPHFKVPMKGHEKTDHKRDKSRKGQTMKRQIMNIFMFTNNFLWLIYEPLVAKGLKRFFGIWPNPNWPKLGKKGTTG